VIKLSRLKLIREMNIKHTLEYQEEREYLKDFVAHEIIRQTTILNKV
jgi:hypothetical protein